MKKYLFLSLLVLTGCFPNQTVTPDDNGIDDSSENMMIEDNDPSNDDDDMVEGNEESMHDDAMMEGVVYAAFSESVLSDGQPKVLFFHAAWCPECKHANTELEEIFSNEHPMLSVYKIDYDTSLELRSQYGVTHQHTFVLVDGQGNAIRTIQGPTDAQLEALVGATDE